MKIRLKNCCRNAGFDTFEHITTSLALLALIFAMVGYGLIRARKNVLERQRAPAATTVQATTNSTEIPWIKATTEGRHTYLLLNEAWRPDEPARIIHVLSEFEKQKGVKVVSCRHEHIGPTEDLRGLYLIHDPALAAELPDKASR